MTGTLHLLRAGYLFRKDAFSANRLKSRNLGIKMLIFCRDARVTDDH
jgi:hypothetical protein